MSHNEIEDGMGFSGLAPTKAERRLEKERRERKPETCKHTSGEGPYDDDTTACGHTIDFHWAGASTFCPHCGRLVAYASPS